MGSKGSSQKLSYAIDKWSFQMYFSSYVLDYRQESGSPSLVNFNFGFKLLHLLL